MARWARLLGLDLKVASSDPPIVDQTPHLAALCWPLRFSWKMMYAFISLMKEVNDKKQKVGVIALIALPDRLSRTSHEKANWQRLVETINNQTDYHAVRPLNCSLLYKSSS